MVGERITPALEAITVRQVADQAPAVMVATTGMLQTHQDMAVAVVAEQERSRQIVLWRAMDLVVL